MRELTIKPFIFMKFKMYYCKICYRISLRNKMQGTFTLESTCYHNQRAFSETSVKVSSIYFPSTFFKSF